LKLLKFESSLETKANTKQRENMEQAMKLTELIDEFKEKISDKEYKDTVEAVAEFLKVKTKFIRVKRIYMVSKVYWEDSEGEDGICVYDSRSKDPWDSSLSFTHDSRDNDEPHLKGIHMRAEMKYDETILQVLPERDYHIKNSISQEDCDEMKQKSMIKRGDIIYTYIEDIE